MATTRRTGDGRDILVQDLVHHLVQRGGGAHERRPPSSALVQHAAKRPEVAGCAVRAAVVEQLGRHVGGRAALGLRPRAVVVLSAS